MGLSSGLSLSPGAARAALSGRRADPREGYPLHPRTCFLANLPRAQKSQVPCLSGAAKKIKSKNIFFHYHYYYCSAATPPPTATPTPTTTPSPPSVSSP